jgi:Rrf2 family protein
MPLPSTALSEDYAPRRPDRSFRRSGSFQEFRMPIFLHSRARLGILAAVDIADNQHLGPVRASVVALRHGLSARACEPALQALTAAGIIKGVRGPSGGYVLARPASAITLRALYEAFEVLESLDEAPTVLRDVVAPRLAEAHGEYLAALAKITLASLLSPEAGPPLLPGRLHKRAVGASRTIAETEPG